MADKIYFVSFRIADTGNWNARYEDLVSRVRECAIGRDYWEQTTSFFAFSSNMSSQQISDYLRGAIDEKVDLVAIGSLTHKVFIVIGKNDDDDIYKFCDFAKRA